MQGSTMQVSSEPSGAAPGELNRNDEGVVSRSMLGWTFTLCAAVAVFFVVFILLQTWPTSQNMRTADHRYAAMTLLKGDGFQTTRNNEPYAKSPPMYPLLLAPLRLLDVEWWTAVCLINAFALAAGVFAVHGLSRLLGLRTSRYLVLAYAVFGPAWYLVREARPDVIFLSSGLIAVWLAAVYWRSRSAWVLLGLAGACSVAVLSRYMALFALLPVVGLVVLFAAHGSLLRKALHVALFLVIAVTPIGMWLERNEELTGYYSGMDRFRERRPADEALTTFESNLTFLGKSLAIDTLAPRDFGELNVLDGDQPVEYSRVSYGVAGGLAALGVLYVFVRRRRVAAAAKDWAARSPSAPATLVIVLGYFFAYQIAILTLWTKGNNDPIDCRFLAPSMFFLLPTAAVGLALLWRASTSVFVRGGIAAAVLAFCALHALKVYFTWERITIAESSPWVEDLDQFVKAIGTTRLESRIIENRTLKGREPRISDKKREKLADKGKILDPSDRKLERAEELADKLGDDPVDVRSVPGPTEEEAVSNTDEAIADADGTKDRGKHKAEERAARIARLQAQRAADRQAKSAQRTRRDDAPDRDEGAPSDDVGSSVEALTEAPSVPADETEPTAPVSPPNSTPSMPTRGVMEPVNPETVLEYIAFGTDPAWEPFVPNNRSESFQLGYYLEEDHSRIGAKLIVTVLTKDRDASPQATINRWLTAFERDESAPAPKAEVIDADRRLTVTLIETVGTYSAPNWPEAKPDYMLIGAVIEHPEQTYHFRALGRRDVVEPQREAIRAFLVSVKALSPEGGALAKDPE